MAFRTIGGPRPKPITAAQPRPSLTAGSCRGMAVSAKSPALAAQPTAPASQALLFQLEVRCCCLQPSNRRSAPSETVSQHMLRPVRAPEVSGRFRSRFSYVFGVCTCASTARSPPSKLGVEYGSVSLTAGHQRLAISRGL